MKQKLMFTAMATMLACPMSKAAFIQPILPPQTNAINQQLQKAGATIMQAIPSSTLQAELSAAVTAAQLAAQQSAQANAQLNQAIQATAQQANFAAGSTAPSWSPAQATGAAAQKRKNDQFYQDSAAAAQKALENYHQASARVASLKTALIAKLQSELAVATAAAQQAAQNLAQANAQVRQAVSEVTRLAQIAKNAPAQQQDAAWAAANQAGEKRVAAQAAAQKAKQDLDQATAQVASLQADLESVQPISIKAQQELEAALAQQKELEQAAAQAEAQVNAAQVDALAKQKKFAQDAAAARAQADAAAHPVWVQWQETDYKEPFPVGTSLDTVFAVLTKKLGFSRYADIKINVNSQKQDNTYVLKQGDFVRAWPTVTGWIEKNSVLNALKNAAETTFNNTVAAAQSMAQTADKAAQTVAQTTEKAVQDAQIVVQQTEEAVKKAGEKVAACSEVVALGASIAGLKIGDFALQGTLIAANGFGKLLTAFGDAANFFTINSVTLETSLAQLENLKSPEFTVNFNAFGSGQTVIMQLDKQTIATAIPKIVNELISGKLPK